MSRLSLSSNSYASPYSSSHSNTMPLGFILNYSQIINESSNRGKPY